FVQGSDGAANLAGARKLEAIRAQFGTAFTYAGDERRDFVIWRHCCSAVLGGRGCRFRNALPPDVDIAGAFGEVRVTPWVWARALRLQQWAKNLLLYVPLLLSGDLLEVDRFGEAT